MKGERKMYKKVELKNGFVGIEKEVAKNWKEKNIIKKNFAMMAHLQPTESHTWDILKQE